MEGPAVAIGIAEGKLQDLVHDRVIQHHDGAVVTTHTNRELNTRCDWCVYPLHEGCCHTGYTIVLHNTVGTRLIHQHSDAQNCRYTADTNNII